MRSGKRAALQVNGSWVMVRVTMKESFAWRALPDNGRRFLDRLEVEHMRHGGSQNGKLACTYDQLHDWGLRKSSIPLAIRQSVGLGFVQVTRPGYKLTPSLYRLTYVFSRTPGSKTGLDPTDEWEAIDTAEKAEAALAAALPCPPRYSSHREAA